MKAQLRIIIFQKPLPKSGKWVLDEAFYALLV
jgi:hypothetical protein